MSFHEEDEEEGAHDYDSEASASLAAVWPGQLSKLASRIGCTVKQLTAFINGNGSITWDAFNNLNAFLDVGPGNGIYDDGSLVYEHGGPYLVVARRKKAAIRAYEELCHGGDVSCSIEVVPDGQISSFPVRFLLFGGGFSLWNVICFPAQENAWSALDKQKDFINFTGAAKVKKSFYQALLSVYKNCESKPLDALNIWEQFCLDHAATLEEIEERYGRGY